MLFDRIVNILRVDCFLVVFDLQFRRLIARVWDLTYLFQWILCDVSTRRKRMQRKMKGWNLPEFVAFQIRIYLQDRFRRHHNILPPDLLVAHSHDYPL